MSANAYQDGSYKSVTALSHFENVHMTEPGRSSNSATVVLNALKYACFRFTGICNYGAS